MARRGSRGALCALLGLCASLLSAPLQGGTLVTLKTPLGDMLLELYDTDKPVTVTNFLTYVRSGAYSNMIFHRWVPGFVIQGGGVYIANRGTTNEGFAHIPTNGTITNEYSVGQKLSNAYGTVAMARVGGKTNSATSQWFINLANNASLDAVDGGFTVFGRVVAGSGTLAKCNPSAPPPWIMDLGTTLDGILNELPILSLNATYDDLVYVDPTVVARPVLQAARKENGDLELTWTHPGRFAAIIQGSPQLPAAWTTLTQTNLPAGSSKVTLPASQASGRFLRLRLE